MPENTKIQWCDHSASPWYGCAHAEIDGKSHPGCEHCYAEAGAKRNPGTLGIWGEDGTRVKSKSFVRNLMRWNKEAAAAGKAVSVFPSLCDPFEDRPELEPWRREMFAISDACPFVRLLLLTKRPQNVRRKWPYVDALKQTYYRPNVFLLTSVSDQATADAMIPELLKCRDLVPVLGLSAEPLLGPVDLRGKCDCFVEAMEGVGNHDPRCSAVKVRKVDWVIVGGESGHGARPFDLDWGASIIQQCRAANVPVFMKQVGSNPMYERQAELAGIQQVFVTGLKDKKGGTMEEWPLDLRVRAFPK